MTTTPQNKYTDDQNILNLDVEQLFNSIFQEIDSRRSRKNLQAGAGKSNDLYGGNNFQESRCHAFYRIIGFPVVASADSFYSPGFDPDLNLNLTTLQNYKGIANSVINNKQFVSQQLNPREDIFKKYAKVFADGGFNSTAISLGSISLRSFDKQFSDGLGPLDFDKKQNQSVGDRRDNLDRFYSNSEDQQSLLDSLEITGLLNSQHLLKPFVVDPRIDNNLSAANISIAAPFLLDNTKLSVFGAGGPSIGSIKRPFIERVITIRFSNSNLETQNFTVVNNIIDTIKSNKNILNEDLIKLSSNPVDQLNNSDLVVFNNYFKLIRSVIDNLIKSILNLQNVRSSINFQPIPDRGRGPEGGANGGKLNQVDANDPHNKEIENNIIELFLHSSISDISLSLDTGISSSVSSSDPGNFAFSNLDDMVFIATKNMQISYQDKLSELKNQRNTTGNQGIEDLKVIEMIMGEFSGLGLIDVIAIQSAFWLMEPSSLLGLIDQRALNRVKTRGINISGTSPNNIIDALTNFETSLKSVYSLIQLYFDQVMSGQNFTVS